MPTLTGVFSENLYNKNVFRKVLKGSKVENLYPKTTSGAQTLAAADASVARNVIIVVEVTEDFVTGDGTSAAQPVFIIGQTGTTNKFVANTLLVNAKKGDKFVIAGQLSATDALLVTGTAASDGSGGTTHSTGAIKVSAALFSVTKA